MLKLFITPNAIVFEDLTDNLFEELCSKGVEFTTFDDEYKVEAEQMYLYKLLVKLSYDYDIEIC